MLQSLAIEKKKKGFHIREGKVRGGGGKIILRGPCYNDSDASF